MGNQSSKQSQELRDLVHQLLGRLDVDHFVRVFQKMDPDGNGSIEGKDLDTFLNDCVDYSTKGRFDVRDPRNQEALTKLRTLFLKENDRNNDKRIDFKELVEILPKHKKDAALFNYYYGFPPSSDFLEAWYKYDKDESGSISVRELGDLIRDLIRQSKKSPANLTEQQINTYLQGVMSSADKNMDGQLQLGELVDFMQPNVNRLEELAHLLKGSNSKPGHAYIVEVLRNGPYAERDFINAEELTEVLRQLLAARGSTKHSQNDLTTARDIVLANSQQSNGRIRPSQVRSFVRLVERNMDSLLHQ